MCAVLMLMGLREDHAASIAHSVVHGTHNGQAWIAQDPSGNWHMYQRKPRFNNDLNYWTYRDTRCRGVHIRLTPVLPSCTTNTYDTSLWRMSHADKQTHSRKA